MALRECLSLYALFVPREREMCQHFITSINKTALSKKDTLWSEVKIRLLFQQLQSF